MKKILAKVFCLILIICVAVSTLIACSESSWKGTVTLKDAGEVKENGGFIAETDKYLYFINGLETSTADNTMGTPLKGALFVAKKDNLAQTEVVVPKLMVATDYGSGFFIDGGYVYYATPSVEKNSEGQIAKDELSFMRTKLDGSGKTDNFFTYAGSNAIDTEYRIVKGENGVVYIYYYDIDNTAIICYNTSTKKSTTVIKQSNTVNGDSLKEHFFLDSEGSDGVVGYYTTTVYTDTYNAEAASKPNYSRKEALYNRVYIIKAGSTEGARLVDGDNDKTTKIDDTKYSISLIKDGYIFFTTTNAGVVETYAIAQSDAKTGDNWTPKKDEEPKITKIVNTEHVVNTTLFVSLKEVYVLGETKVFKTTLTENDKISRKPISIKEGINKLLFVEEGFIYFYNAEGQIAKFLINQTEPGDDKIIFVSEDSAETAWYDVELKTINGKRYLFYCDNSATGKSYIKYVDLSATVLDKDVDGDGINEFFYLDTNKIAVLGKMTDADRASVFDEKVKVQAEYSPSQGITADEEKDKDFKKVIDDLKKEYNELSASVKEKVSTATKNTIEYIDKAFEVAKKYAQLNGIEEIDSAAEEQALKAEYLKIKSYMIDFKNSANREGVDAFISENLKANYTKAVKLFETQD